MKKYQVRVTINVQADDEDHALEQALDQIQDGQFTPSVEEQVTPSPKQRLEYLRDELRAERISYSELAELQSLASYIALDDVELLEAARVPEFEGE